jgi:hypothetical protein
MARKKDNDITSVMENIDFEIENSNADETSMRKKISQNSLKNLKPRKAGTATPKAYMQLNIYDYEDYIYRMSKVNGTTMSGYVLNLIKSDMEKNQKAYEGLKLLDTLDKPSRIAKNKKN